MIITLIAYRPDHDDYCRGCYMGGSSSDLRITAYNVVNPNRGNLYDIAEEIANISMLNKDDRDYADYNWYILIEGHLFVHSNSDYPDHYDRHSPVPEDYEVIADKIFTLSAEIKTELINTKKEEEKIKQEQANLREQQLKEEKEYQTYLQLRNKYEGADIDD